VEENLELLLEVAIRILQIAWFAFSTFWQGVWWVISEFIFSLDHAWYGWIIWIVMWVGMFDGAEAK